MYEPIVDTTGPNLGKLTVWTRTIDRNDNLVRTVLHSINCSVAYPVQVMTPVWRLHNGHGPSWHYGQTQVTTTTSFQVIMEGIWGNTRARKTINIYRHCSSLLRPKICVKCGILTEQ